LLVREKNKYYYEEGKTRRCMDVSIPTEYSFQWAILHALLLFLVREKNKLCYERSDRMNNRSSFRNAFGFVAGWYVACKVCSIIEASTKELVKAIRNR
jgi:hypothetical protein